MKLNKLKLLGATLLLLSSTVAFGHGKDEHAEEAQALDCTAMNDMDHAKMDMKDPVMMAMMKKCSEQMVAAEHDHTGADVAGTVADNIPAAAHGEHEHAAVAAKPEAHTDH